jgi:cytochrome b
MSAAGKPATVLARSAAQRQPGILAWDLPTRLFKWSLVILVVTAWVASGFDDPVMAIHKAAGYGVLVLVVYRVLWGFFGGSTARFGSFVRSPRAALRYAKAARENRAPPYLGHNPAGGLMVVALLFVCGIQTLLGLFASDGVLASGPFADAVGATLSGWAASAHAAWFYVILALAVAHIGVNLFHQFVKRDNLIGAMVTGRKADGRYVDRAGAVKGSVLVALICLCVAVGLVYLGVTLPGGQFFPAQ